MNKIIKSLSGHLLVTALCVGSLSALGVTPGTVTPASEAASSQIKLKKKSATLSIIQDGAKIKTKTAKIQIKKKKGVKIKKIQYASQDKSVAKVSKKGVVTPKSIGLAKIKVSVKYRYKKKTKNKTLIFKARVNQSYRHILSGLTLKYKTYATFVGGAEGIKPVYDTRVSMDAKFFAWNCLSMKVADPSIAGIGENGYVVGKKTGTTTITISSTDDTKLSVKATLKVFATRADLEEKDDLYNNVRAEYLPAVEKGWTEEEKECYVRPDGSVRWSQSARIGFQKDKNKKKLIETYTSAGKQPDNTPEDALNSILTTGQVMINGGDAAEEAYLQTIRDEVITPIREAGSIDELIAVSEDLEKRGLPGFACLSGFFKYRENEQFYQDAFQRKIPLPTEPTDIKPKYMPKMKAAVNQAGFTGTTDAKKKSMRDGFSMFFKALGFDDPSEKDLNDYIDLLTEYSNGFYSENNTEWNKPIKEIEETFPNLHIKEHMQKKGYKVSENDLIQVVAPAGYTVLNDCLAKESNLNILKYYLADVATFHLLEYSRLSLKAAYIMNPEIYSDLDDSEKQQSLEEDYLKQMEGLESAVPWDLDHIYTKTVYPADYKTRFEKLVQEYKATYREAIEESKYDPTFKANMLKKIDNLKVSSLYPDDATYKKYEIPYDLTTAAEGGNLAENLLKVYQYRANLECMTVGTKYGSMDWWFLEDDLFQGLPSTLNAFYDFSNNHCIFMHGGIGLNILFYEETGDETETEIKNLGYLATTIGHEMGHVFDTTGSLFDEKGDLVDPWGSDDLNVYYDKVNKLAQLYDSMAFYADRAGKKAYYQDGFKVIGEAMADLGGTEISLRIIQKKYPGRDDLIRKFYRYSAEQWMSTEQDEIPPYGISEIQNDVHPAPRQRANGVASMMDEFYRVFDVSETDAMYVAPEDRVSLWNN